MTADELLAGLRRLCGYVEDGSQTYITIAQDDATRDWAIEIEFSSSCRRTYTARSFEEVIRTAIDKEESDGHDS